jgi:phytol kinase
VERRSLGEIYFVLSVVILFGLSNGDPILFCIPMLILTLADAIAAIIGIRYGQLRYITTDGQKSAEGSITFFTLAFFSTHIPLLLFSDTGRAETLLIALIIGLLVMLLEAIAWNGIDNLLIPLGGFILLRSQLEMEIPDLLTRFIVTVVLVSFVLCWRNRTTLNDGALLGAAFWGYLSWSLGGWLWLLPPLTLFITYPFFIAWVDQQKDPLTPLEQKVMLWLPRNPQAKPRHWERVHSVYIVLSVSAAGSLWLLLFTLFDRPEFLYPYTLAFAANLAVVGVAGLSPVHYWQVSSLVSILVSILKSCFLMLMPLVVLQGFSASILTFAGVGIAVTGGVAIAYYLTQPHLRNCTTDIPAWICRAIYTTIGSLAGLFWVF